MVFGELPIHKGIKGVYYWEVGTEEKRIMNRGEVKEAKQK